MSGVKQLLNDIENAPSGSRVVAIFDFDGTLIAGYSATAFIREQLKRGDLSVRQFVALMRAMTNFGLGNMGFSGMMAINAQFMRGIEEETYHEVGRQLYTKQIARLIYPESRALVEAHRAKGHTVAIISSATPYQVETPLQAWALITCCAHAWRLKAASSQAALSALPALGKARSTPQNR